MLKNLCALVLIVLSALPFTAPFRTYDMASAQASSAVVAPADTDDPAFVSRVLSDAGRPRVAPAPAIFAFSHRAVRSLAHPSPPTSLSGPDSNRSTVLRL